MNDDPHARHFWDQPLVFWGALALGLIALAAMFLGRSLLPDDGEARAARSAQLEAQAVAAEARQDQAATAEDARRADLMN